jgi:hypothetical protein
MQLPLPVSRYCEKKGGAIMRTLGKIAATIGVVGAIAAGSAVPAAADWYHGHHHRYYNYYGGGTWNGCPPDWTIQGGVCKPYRHGPWDIYGGRQSDYGW